MTMYDKMVSGSPYFIAELSANHGNSLNRALALVRAAKAAGAHCVKTQTYTADTLTIDSQREAFRIKGGLWDGYTNYALYAEASMPWEWNAVIKAECEGLGLDFLSTAFDETAVDYLEELGVQCHKIASFELVHIPLIEYMASKNKPVILSCGIGSAEEIGEAVGVCRRAGNDRLLLLKCCSEYPAHFEDMNLLTIRDMTDRFGLPTGLSDHSMGSLAPVVAALHGARVIEKHFCLSRSVRTPDSAFSMEPGEFKKMTEDVTNALAISGKSTYALSEGEKRQTGSRRSIYAVQDIAPGERFTPENCHVLRPGFGLHPRYYPALLGKESCRPIGRGEPILPGDLGDASC